jgi:acylphosphatase
VTGAELTHRKIIVAGIVQGVGFRYSCKRMAQALGVKGFVRNMNDGNVYIEAEGTELQITQFISWCRQGPSHARVTDVIISEGELKSFKFFDVRH